MTDSGTAATGKTNSTSTATPSTPPNTPQHAALAGAVRAVSGMTLLSRLGGLIRDVMLIHVFGATAIGSAFLAGFTVPNTFRRLFGEGALSAAFLPDYAATDKSDPAAAQRFASLTVALMLLITGAITVVAELALLLALWLSPPNPERELMLTLVMLMFPFMPFICATAILGGMLQVHGKFAAASSGPLILNGFIIATGAWHLLHDTTGGRGTAYALGIATVLSGLTQALWFAWLLKPHVKWTRAFQDAAPRVRAMFKRMVPVLLGLGTLQINTLMDTLIASASIWLGPTVLGQPYPLNDGSTVLLTAASRLYQFPLGVFGIAVATAVFPMLARFANEPDRFASTLRRAVRLSLFIGLPASVGLVLVRDQAMGVLFRFGGRGMTAEEVGHAALVLAGFAPGIWAYSLNHVFTRTFYARGDTMTPMKIAVATVGLNFLLNITLIWWLREAGLAWSTSIAATVQCVVLAVVCRAKFNVSVIERAAVLGVLRLILITTLMGTSVWAALRFMPGGTGWKHDATNLAVACTLGASVYIALAVLTKAPEIRWIMERRTQPTANTPR